MLETVPSDEINQAYLRLSILSDECTSVGAGSCGAGWRPLCCEASSIRAQLGNTRRSGSGQQPLPSEDQLQARNEGACPRSSLRLETFPYSLMRNTDIRERNALVRSTRCVNDCCIWLNCCVISLVIREIPYTPSVVRICGGTPCGRPLDPSRGPTTMSEPWDCPSSGNVVVLFAGAKRLRGPSGGWSAMRDGCSPFF